LWKKGKGFTLEKQNGLSFCKQKPSEKSLSEATMNNKEVSEKREQNWEQVQVKVFVALLTYFVAL